MPVSFLPGERATIEAAEEYVRSLLGEHPELRRPGFPYIQHHRWARPEISRGARRGKLVFEEIATLLLEWSRVNGDLRLYVWQPYVNWARTNPTAGQFLDALAPVVEVVDAVPVGFIAFARQAAGKLVAAE